jgi:hypothetical protein
MGVIVHGANPAEAKRKARAEPTFAEVFERFLKEERKRNKEFFRPSATARKARSVGRSRRPRRFQRSTEGLKPCKCPPIR